MVECLSLYLLKGLTLRILQVNSADKAGGAEGSSWRLFQAYQQLGHESWLAVGKKRSNHEHVLQIPNDNSRSKWVQTVYGFLDASLASSRDGKLPFHMVSLMRLAAEPRRWMERYLGIEDFNYPGSRRLLRLLPHSPNLVHLHNLHGDYFDLRMLPKLSRQVPTIVNPRDAWPISGHCAHSFACERWKTGCGNCPDLSIYPMARRDATAYNWKRKKHIFHQSRLYLVTPSHWLMQKIEQSMMADAIVRNMVIPNGVDLSDFFPIDAKKARVKLGLPLDSQILLFTANGIRNNIWKDYKMLQSVIALVAERLRDRRILFVALGEEGPAQEIFNAEIRFVPFQPDPRVVAAYYQAADVYVHAARADTFPNTVLESLACATPVVATRTGGIPEQVKGLADRNESGYDENNATGLLINPGDAMGMASAIIKLLTDEALRLRLGRNAFQDSRQRFDFGQQVNRFLNWYEEVIDHWTRTVGPAS